MQPQIDNITLPTNGAKWTITANLPSGKIGESGLQGPNGKPGLPGNKGKIGPKGPRGKGGKDSTEGFSSGFNEPFNPRM